MIRSSTVIFSQGRRIGIVKETDTFGTKSNKPVLSIPFVKPIIGINGKSSSRTVKASSIVRTMTKIRILLIMISEVHGQEKSLGTLKTSLL